MSISKKIKIAVAGGGYWGKNLVRNFAELGVIKTLCDTNQSTRDDMAKQYEDLTTTSDYNSILQDNSISGVVIATPAIKHYSMAKKALQAGKDVFVEKPLALTITEGEELAVLAKRHKRVLMVGHILEYHPAIQKLVEMVKVGEVGEIRYIYSNRLNMGKIRTEENILWSFAPHDISVILRLLGEMPVSVSACGGAYLNSEIADVTTTNLFFKSKVHAHIFVSWLHPFKEQKLVVVGSDQMAVFNDLEANKLLLYNSKINWVDRRPIASKGDVEIIETEKHEPLKQECIHFLDCIQDRKEPLTGAKNALDVLRVLSASQESMEAFGEKVNIDTTAKMLKDVFIHPTSIVEPGSIIRKGTYIWHFSHIMPDAIVGEGCNIGQNVFVGRGVKIGNNVKIQNNVSVYEGVVLEDDVFCGPSCVFTNVKIPRSAYPRITRENYESTLVRKGASIGANATIICGVTIGEHALIGGGAVITKDVPPHAVVYGNPARIMGWNCKCGKVIVEKNASKLLCDVCGTKLSIY